MDHILGMYGSDKLTNVSVASVSGVVMQRFTVGAINLLHATPAQAEQNLAEAFVTAQLAGYSIQNCRQVCAGVAGLQAVETATTLVPSLRGVMRRCGYTDDALLVSDEQVRLAGALGKSTGAVLSAGRFSTCYGQNKIGRQHRTGGLGVLADDDGSAYAIGREILRRVARACDGRGGATILTTQVFAQFGLSSVADLSRLLRSAAPAVEDICALAGLLAGACQRKDKVALAIVERAADQQVELVAPVVNLLGLQKEALAVTGSVLLNDAFVGVAFKKRMAEQFPELQCVPPRDDAAAGAVLLAKERLALRARS